MADTGLKRELGLMDSAMIVMGSMIGSGIFIVSADIARTVGCSGWLLMVWIITGFITVAAALSYGELAAMMPRAGGQYVYLREAYSPMAGFLYGWTLFLVIQTGTIAAVAVAFAKYTAVLLPWFSENHVLFSAGSFKISAAQVLAIAQIALLTWINLRGLKQGKLVQNVFTSAKIVALACLIVLVLALGRNPDAVSANLRNAWEAVWWKASGSQALSGGMLLAAVGVAMVGSLFASDAWNNITFTAGEVSEPQRNIPLSLVLGTAAVTALYVLANVAYLAALPVSGSPDALDAVGRGMQFAVNDRVTTAAVSFFGAKAEMLLALLIMVSTFGCNNGLILAGARVYYAMAQDGLFFKKVGELNRNAVPGAALKLQALWAGALCLSGTYGDLLDYVIFAVLIFYALTVVGIFLLRKKRPDAPRPYKAWGYPWLPGFYVVAASAICLDLLVFKPKYTWPGVIIVLLGIPVYFAWSRCRTLGLEKP